MDNRKNTILLTVIAVATLLVAVVGATFAFFTAQNGADAQADVTVKTDTSDSSSFGTWDAISFTANEENFGQGATPGTAGDSLSGTSTGTVEFTASTAAAASFCYSASLELTENTFVYSVKNREKATAAGTDPEAELVFTAKKGSGFTVSGDTKTLNDAVTLINAQDVTTLGTGTANAVKIPTTAGGTEYVHRIVANKGSKVTEAWELTVTFVNLDVDQSFGETTADTNAGKAFTGAIKFTQVKDGCTAPTAEELAAFETPAA